MRCGCIAGFLLALSALGAPALADDAAAVADAHQRVRGHMKAERWSSAVDGIRKLMEDHPGSSAVLDRLEALETDLRRSLFRVQAKQPAADILFGKATKGFVVAERRLTLEYPDGPGGEDWTESSVGTSHAVPFDSDVAVEFVAPTMDRDTKGAVSVCLCEANPGKPVRSPGKYDISPGACSEDSEYVYTLPGTIVRVDGGMVLRSEAKRTLVSKPAPGKVTLDQVQTYRVVRRDAGINVSVDGKAFLVCQDSRFPVTTVSLSGVRIRKLTIRGVVEESYYLDLLEKRYALEQKTWEEKGYVRSEVLPPWVLDASAGTAAPPAPAK